MLLDGIKYNHKGVQGLEMNVSKYILDPRISLKAPSVVRKSTKGP